jgi:hypothetical protein
MPVMDADAATRAIRARELQHGVAPANLLALTAVIEEGVAKRAARHARPFSRRSAMQPPRVTLTLLTRSAKPRA